MLPHKPSDLIELALGDLIKCERSKKYHIDMEMWHSPNGTCAVCLAGAVMSQEFDVPHTKSAGGASCEPWFTQDDSDKFDALDEFRQGNTGYAFEALGRSKDFGHRFNRHITPYDESPDKFKREMRKLARDLRAARR